ncbi:sperm receptor for egg jelly-like isoform X5 [Lytechinus pictus]|uniref:sperm receptor for egg jelly-like isoform X5 n=1 Tax=Lytechinus pictus TaxID=7653 RepID=UPI0030B9B5E3
MSFDIVFISFVTAILFRNAGPAEYGCEREWIYDSANGRCYFFNSEFLTWVQARDACISLDANLTSIHSAEEDAFIMGFITNYVWIGATDLENEGVLKFTDGTPMDFEFLGNTSSTAIPPTTIEGTSITAVIPDITSFATGRTSSFSDIIQIEFLLFPSVESSIDHMFRVNDTILVLASIFGSFRAISSQIIWSITDLLSGDSFEYTVYSEDAVLLSLTIPSVFTIDATAIGKSYNLTTTANATVLPTTHILCPTHVFTNQVMWCALLTDSIVEHLSYTFCFEHSADSCLTTNPRSWSLSDVPSALTESVSSMDGYFASFLSHRYSSLGTYEVSSWVFHTLAAKVNVIVKHSCISSLTMEAKETCNSLYPGVHFKAFNIHAMAHMEIDEQCIEPMSTHLKWWIVTSDVDGAIVTVFERITHTHQVTIPGGILPYGTHSLNLKAETRKKASEEIIVEEHIATQLEIQPSSLVAVINGGASRSHGVCSSLIVDGSTSYDPDVTDGSSSDLTFLWYCVMVDGETTYLSIDEAIQNTDDACFEGEEILMNSTSTTLVVMANKLNADVTMDFWLNVLKEGRVSGLTKQRIHLKAGRLPDVQMSCISNCNTYLLTAERLVLHASCSNCDSEDVSFQWSLESDGSTVFSDLSTNTTTGLDQPYLVIKPHTFDSFSESTGIALRVRGFQSTFDSEGYAEFVVNLSAPPALGCCVVTPREGYALQTDFTVISFGFTNVDKPLTYRIVLFNRVDFVNGEFKGRGEGFLLYEGSKGFIDDIYLPVGDSANDYTVLLQVTAQDCYGASTTIFVTANVYPPTTLSQPPTAQEYLEMRLFVESNVNALLAVGDIGRAAQVIYVLGSILNVIGEEGATNEDEDGRGSRAEIRSSFIDTIAAIPIESMTSLLQNSAALACITRNTQEILTNVQMEAVSVLTEMTLFLNSKSGSYTQAQEDIESAGRILIEGLSNILISAEDNLQEDHYKNLMEVAMSTTSDIQDAIVAGKIPSEEATIITSPMLSLAVGSISKDKLAETTFRGSETTGSFRMPSAEDIHHSMEHVHDTVISIKMAAWSRNPFPWAAGGDSVRSSIVEIQLAGDHVLDFHDLTADIDVHIPMRDTLLTKPTAVHLTKNASASVIIDPSSLPVEGALYLTISAKTEPLVVLSVCTASVNIQEPSCIGSHLILSVDNTPLDSATNYTWNIPLNDLNASNGIMIRLHDGKDQPEYEDDNITLSVFMHTLQCNFWHEDREEWDSEGCKVGPLSYPSSTHCQCNHLTFLGVSVLVPPSQVTIFNDPTPVESGHIHHHDEDPGLHFLLWVIIGYFSYCLLILICMGCLIGIKICIDR